MDHRQPETPEAFSRRNGVTMPYSHAGVDVAFRGPEWVHEMFTQSIAGAVAARGEGLEALSWDVRSEHGEIYVHGTPTAECERPVAVCREWALALGLEEQDYDADEALSSWYHYESPWLIEVVARSH
jgi:hypothetical protein